MHTNLSNNVDRWSFGRSLLSALTIGGLLVAAAVTLPAATASLAGYVTASDIISTGAGTGIAGASGDGGPAPVAQLNTPRDIDVGPDGSLYVADMSNNKIRKVVPNGTISTVVGTGVAGSTGDGGPATAATITWPHDILIDDSTGILYVPDSNNCRIRQVDTNGVITPFAGTGVCGYGGDGGDARLAKLKYPKGLAVYGGESPRV